MIAKILKNRTFFYISLNIIDLKWLRNLFGNNVPGERIKLNLIIRDSRKFLN